MINEAIQGMTIIQCFSPAKGNDPKNSNNLNEEYTQYQNKLLSLNSLTSHNLMNVVRNLFFFGLIWYVGGSSINTLITVGVLYAFVDYLNRMFHPMVGIVNQLPNLERALVSADRVFELLDEQGIDVAAEKADRYLGNVKFEHVRFAYKEGEDVLKDISFEAKQGQTVALVGHTGSGKSSILNLLFRFYDVNERPDHGGWPRYARDAQTAASPAYGHRAAGSVPVHRDDRVQCQLGRSVHHPGTGGGCAARGWRRGDVQEPAARHR